VNYWEKSHQWCPSKWVIGLSIKCVSYGVWHGHGDAYNFKILCVWELLGTKLM
jgi:hypothetical protein